MRRSTLVLFAAIVVASGVIAAGVTDAGAQPASQVVDNNTEGRFKADEGWGTSSYGRGVEGDNYRFARASESAGFAEFKIEIPEAARYAVYARWPQVKGLNGSVPVGVKTSSGLQWTWVDQRQNGGEWVRIGVFEMPAGDDYSVVFSRQTSGEEYVIADAVKVEYDSASAPPPEPTENEEARSSSDSSKSEGRSGNDVVREAKTWIGVRYRHGGQTRKGVDCSGLTMQVFKKFGVRLPHWDDKQFRMGKRVPKGQEKPGDLVFFDEHGRGISHVGIYSGNGKLIHASDYFNKVTESDMRYIKGYKGARRMDVNGRSSAAEPSEEPPAESRTESEDPPETEAAQPPVAQEESPSPERSPSTGSGTQKVAPKQQVKDEKTNGSRTWIQRVVRQLRPDDTQEQAPAPSKTEPEVTGNK